LKASNYNHFISFSGAQSIAYNARTNALALIDNDKLDVYKQFVEKGINIEDSQLVSDLMLGSFLLSDEINELDLVRLNMLRGRYATSALSFTVVPTSACNFRCIYCYEKNAIGHEYMSESIQDAVVTALETRKDCTQVFSVSWFGGEPLLELPIIEKLSVRLMNICEQANIKYSAKLITNGYLLTKETLEILKKVKVDFIQVTLDGGPEQHNKRRPLANGGETFWQILKNLQAGYDLLPRVALRINIDNDNVSAGEQIKNYIDENGLSGKVTPYFGRTRNDNDCYSDDKCINSCDFAEIEFDYAYEVEQSKEKGAVYYPDVKSFFCCADRINSFVIAPSGALYKCWVDIGNPDKYVGDIANPFKNINNTLLNYMLFDPTSVLQCKDCDILPICMGGCPYQRVERGDQECLRHKYILERCLVNATKALKQAKQLSEK